MDGSHDGPTSLVTEVTPNLYVFARTIPRAGHPFVWCEAPPRALELVAELRRKDLDSEGDNERSFFERQPPPRLKARAQLSRRKEQSEPRNHEGVLPVRSSNGAPRIFANKRDRCEDEGAAAVVGAHAWRRRRVVMRTARGRGVVTPDLAQQAGVLPNRQRQHDRKESGSKHVILATPKGKTCASQKGGDLGKY